MVENLYSDLYVILVSWLDKANFTDLARLLLLQKATYVV